MSHAFAETTQKTNSVTFPIKTRNNLNHNSASTSTQQTEKRLLSAISRIEKTLKHTEEQVQMLVGMVNHFYLDLMMHIPSVPEELRPAAIAMVKRRYSQWLEKIGITTTTIT